MTNIIGRKIDGFCWYVSAWLYYIVFCFLLQMRFWFKRCRQAYDGTSSACGGAPTLSGRTATSRREVGKFAFRFFLFLGWFGVIFGNNVGIFGSFFW